MIRPTSPFTITIAEPGCGSVDPYGRPDTRFRNSTPARLRASFEIEFEEADYAQLREALKPLGIDLPEQKRSAA